MKEGKNKDRNKGERYKNMKMKIFSVQTPKILQRNGWGLWRKGNGRGSNPAHKAKDRGQYSN